ncbi:hypothetical protein F8M41_004137 [Gigaspora margarita]|uniref:Uncharacterized protein n=1 Tax=Gigaspora margarita TaxID=4874 RepID=A0A8H3XA57_GIGMA|nr:hypothetical protein F8M41_004137 [Gigaspora margarita]
MYRTKVENFCPIDFVKAKEYALQIENFHRDREQNNRKSQLIVEKKSHSSDSDIDSITATIEALNINRVKQENDNKIDKIESDIKELMKAVKELTNINSLTRHFISRGSNVVHSSRPQRVNNNTRRYFNC